jgi:hypothetical protein
MLQQPAPKDAAANLFCKFCGTTLALRRVEPSLTPDHDRITYQCGKCGHSLVKEVPYR